MMVSVAVAVTATVTYVGHAACPRRCREQCCRTGAILQTPDVGVTGLYPLRLFVFWGDLPAWPL